MLVMGADDDKTITVAEVEATARAYGTEAVILPGIAHHMMLDQGWQAVADRMLAWLLEKATLFAPEPGTAPVFQGRGAWTLTRHVLTCSAPRSSTCRASHHPGWWRWPSGDGCRVRRRSPRRSGQVLAAPTATRRPRQILCDRLLLARDAVRPLVGSGRPED